MIKINKLILPALIVGTLGFIYLLYFAPTDSLGSFNSYKDGSEINQEINVKVVHSEGFNTNSNGELISFYAEDKNKRRAFVSLHEPLNVVFSEIKILKLLGHMHGDNFSAAKATVLD